MGRSAAVAAASVPSGIRPGGVTPEKIPALVGAGARHFVVVRYLTEANDPQKAARRLRQAIDAVLEG